MKVFLTSLFANATALYLVARLLPGINIDNLVPPDGFITQQGLISVLIGAIVMGALNASIGPILKLLSLPLTCLTLGLFSLVVTGIIFNIGAWLTPGMHVQSFWWAIGGGIIFGLLNSIIGGLLGTHKEYQEA